jgi:hypothetical protein
MSFFKFNKNEVMLNSVRSHPEVRVYIAQSASYYNNSGQAGIEPINHVSGSTLEVERNAYNSRPLFVTTASYDSALALPSDIYTKDYYLSSSALIGSEYIAGAIPVYPTSPPNARLSALKNTLNHYTKNSVHYAFSSSIEGMEWFKPEQDMMLISIPSVLYGSQIQEGTVDLKYYDMGSLKGRLTDSNKRGELIQDGGANDGEVAGVVLYNEGFIILTGSWSLGGPGIAWPSPATTDTNRWKYFGYQVSALSRPSFDISFNGTTYTPTMTMFAHANRGELNSSNNPTFTQHSSSANANQKTLVTGSYIYMENDKQTVENVASSSFQSTGTFEKTTYLSSVGIYDDNQNLVGIAKLATPVRKREKDSYTFKLKLDL